MNLIVDIGNTRVKVAVVDSGTIVADFMAPELEELPLDEIVAAYPIKRSILSTTRGCGESSAEYVRQVVGHCLLFDTSVATPLKIDYATPQTLGRDRVAAAVGAASKYRGEDLMIVDFGTAITIDILSSDGIFEGGFISPGVSTRFRSLNEYTSSLPLCQPSNRVVGTAKTTEDAIVGGVMNGIKYEIEGYIERYRAEKCKLLIIFSGGDSIFFEKQIKNAIFADRELIFRGLDTILEYNV